MAIRLKVVKEGWGNDRSWHPCLHLVGRRMVLLLKAQGLPAAEVCRQSFNQIVLESGVVDHLYEEAV